MDHLQSQKSDEESSLFENEEQKLEEEEAMLSSERNDSQLEECSKPICRICLNGNSSERLISPCECNGSIRFVHKDCLESWLSTKTEDKCELCYHNFETIRTRKKLRDWWVDPSTIKDRVKFLGVLLCLLVVISLTSACLYYLTRGPYDQYKSGKKGFVSLTVLAALTAFLLVGFITLTILFVRHYCAIWKEWSMRCSTVKIVIPDASDVSIHIHDQELNSNTSSLNLSIIFRTHHPSNSISSDSNSAINEEAKISRSRSEPIIIFFTDTEDDLPIHGSCFSL